MPLTYNTAFSVAFCSLPFVLFIGIGATLISYCFLDTKPHRRVLFAVIGNLTNDLKHRVKYAHRIDILLFRFLHT